MWHNFFCKGKKEKRNVNMTEWKWPNEFDRNLWIWPNVEKVINNTTTTNVYVWIWPNVEIIVTTTNVICYMLWIVKQIFHNDKPICVIIFGHIQSFSVMFNKWTFVIVIFGLVHTWKVPRFRLYSTLGFSHPHSVKLTSLKENWKI